jgi:hypothetical protein
MARIVTSDGLVLYDELSDLRGDAMQKNVEKAHGPWAKWSDGSFVRLCPLCKCQKSFDPDTPNQQHPTCDGECACHDG